MNASRAVSHDGPMNERARRIVETAVELAEQGGFEAVRLRDLASEAGVALGTVYRYFRSKEDLLVAALQWEVDQLRGRIKARSPLGDTPLEGVTRFFSIATRVFCKRAKLARAVLRAVATGDPELTRRVTQFHSDVTEMVTQALRGSRETEAPPTEFEANVAWVLHHVWFAALVGWSGGLHGQSTVVDRVSTAAELLLREGIPPH
jgi:AcrR family transcriptional regulator